MRSTWLLLTVFEEKNVMCAAMCCIICTVQICYEPISIHGGKAVQHPWRENSVWTFWDPPTWNLDLVFSNAWSSLVKEMEQLHGIVIHQMVRLTPGAIDLSAQCIKWDHPEQRGWELICGNTNQPVIDWLSYVVVSSITIDPWITPEPLPSQTGAIRISIESLLFKNHDSLNDPLPSTW